MSPINIKSVKIDKPDDFTVNLILGQTHFIKSVEDIHEAMVTAVPNAKFGLAFCEASGPKRIRYSGTDKEMIELAKNNAKKVRCGHVFIVFMKDIFPINVLRDIKNVAEVCTIFCATANPVEVIVVESEFGRGVLGVIDGESLGEFETKKDKAERHKFLRSIGYKL
jgi:hypothetical protein